MLSWPLLSAMAMGGGGNVHSRCKERGDEHVQSVNLVTVNDLMVNMNRMLPTLKQEEQSWNSNAHLRAPSTLAPQT